MYKKRIKSKIVLSVVISIALTIGYSAIVRAEGTSIKRIYGNDSIETSIKIAEELKSTSNTYVITTNDNYPDALAGIILAAKYNAPILFISNGDNSKVHNYLKSVNVNKNTKFFILGGTGVVSQSIEDYLRAINSYRL